MKSYEQERKEINKRYNHKINKINRRLKVKQQELKAELDIMLAIIARHTN